MVAMNTDAKKYYSLSFPLLQTSRSSFLQYDIQFCCTTQDSSSFYFIELNEDIKKKGKTQVGYIERTHMVQLTQEKV